MAKTGIQTIDYIEKKSGQKRYVLYPVVLQLDNGNIVIVSRIEYHRNSKKLVLYYEDDTEELKKTIELLSNYYKFIELYKQTGNQSAMIQASAYLMKLDDMYNGFDIVQLEQSKQTILDSYKSPNDLINIAETVKLHPTIIKAILVLNGKITIK